MLLVVEWIFLDWMFRINTFEGSMARRVSASMDCSGEWCSSSKDESEESYVDESSSPSSSPSPVCG